MKNKETEILRWYYSRGHGTLDLVSPSYTCLIKERGGPIHIYAKGSQTPDLIFYPDAGFSEKPGKYTLETGDKELAGKGEQIEFIYSCEDGVRLAITFFIDRIEVKADRNGEEISPDTFYIGRGSKLYTNKVFSPSQPDFHLPVGHYLRPETAVDLCPGLMTPAPWCFSAQQDNSEWMGFSLEPYENELNFAGFGSAPGVGRDFCWRVIYNGCMPACESLSIPVLVMRFAMKDEFEVFERHTEHLLECGKVEKPQKIYDWHSGVSVCGWHWQRGTAPDRELYDTNLAMLDNNDIEYDIVIIDDFWGDSKQHGIWKACERWQDLREFVDNQHAKGRYVLLWVCTEGHGLPENEMTSNQLQKIDSKEWAERLREDAHRMLSSDPGCYNADGIKFDFTALYPTKPECSHYGVGYILERYRMVAEAMRAVKPDAMLLNQSVNPYFIKYQSAIRLNDFTALPCHGLEEMQIRGRIARAVGMGLPIDSDHVTCSTQSYEGAIDFFEEMETVGEVSLYLKESDLQTPGLLEAVQKLTKKHALKNRK